LATKGSVTPPAHEQYRCHKSTIVRYRYMVVTSLTRAGTEVHIRIVFHNPSDGPVTI